MRGLLPIILAVVALAALAGCAHAEEASGSKAIAHGETIDVGIDFYEGDWLDVSYQVTVVSGARVWVYFVPSSGYDEYHDPAQDSFTYYEYWSSLNTRSAVKEFSLDEQGTYYLIIENSDESGAIAFVQYSVSYVPGSEPTNAGLFACLAIAVIGIPIVIVAVVLLARRRARSASAFPGATSGAPGQLPGQYPQQQPWGYQQDPYAQGQYPDGQYPGGQYRYGYGDPYHDHYHDYHHDHHDHGSWGSGPSWGSSRGSSSRSHSSSRSPTSRMGKRR